MSEIVVPFVWGRRQTPPVSVPGDAAPRYPARVARQLALAWALQRRIHTGEFSNPADMARGLGFTRARVTQLLDLLLLAPDIQEEILFLECPPGHQPIHESDLRTVVRLPLWSDQRRAWAVLARANARHPQIPASRLLRPEEAVVGPARAVARASLRAI